jgi:hypothetical protein
VRNILGGSNLTLELLTWNRDILIANSTVLTNGACGSVVVKASCYKPEGRGFETR